MLSEDLPGWGSELLRQEPCRKENFCLTPQPYMKSKIRCIGVDPSVDQHK